jgi:hypothetical protein
VSPPLPTTPERSPRAAFRDFSTREEIAAETGEDPRTIAEDRIGAAVITCK